MESYVQGALRNELCIAPFVESFKTATLGGLPALGTIYLHIAFLPNFADGSLCTECSTKVVAQCSFRRGL